MSDAEAQDIDVAEAQDIDAAEALGDWKQQARKWEQRAKQNHDALIEAEAKLVEAENAARLVDLKYRVAAEAGLDPSLGRRLQGSTLEELQADVEVFKAGIATPRVHVLPPQNMNANRAVGWSDDDPRIERLNVLMQAPGQPSR